jgi:hypothetical protein
MEVTGETLGFPRGGLRAAERAIGQPELTDDLGDTEVAVEALAPGRAERALERAAGLRGDAQRAACGLGNENGLYGVIGADVQQPFARAVRRRRVAPHRRRFDRRTLGQRFAKPFRDVGHRAEIVDAGLMDPAHELFRAKRLFAERGAERLQLACGQAE